MSDVLRAFGNPRPSALNVHALEAVAESVPRGHFFDLPTPTGAAPFRMDLASVLPPAAISAIRDKGRIVFHMVGDTGGIREAVPQTIVASMLETNFNTGAASGRPAFFYHLGDVVYYNGESREYYPQFYQPYEHYPGPIMGIPGNHDGWATGGESSLDAFVRNFCSPNADPTADAQDLDRGAMTQPNVYWTLEAPFATIIGLYSNVNEGGTIEQNQEDWFTEELAHAPADKAVIVAVHHPVYSVASTHTGSQRLYGLLERAMDKSHRVPDLVACAHVHNYQRFTKEIGGYQVPFLVAGAGGYYHLHKVPNINGERVVTPMHVHDADVVLEKYLDDRHGFLRMTVSGRHLHGAYYSVPRPHESWSGGPRLFDQFTVDLTTHRLI